MKDTKGDKQAAANAEENRKKIKEIEASITNLNNKFSSEIENLRMMQTVGGGGGDDNGASAKMFEMTVKKMEQKHAEFARGMKQIDIKVQNALTDI